MFFNFLCIKKKKVVVVGRGFKVKMDFLNVGEIGPWLSVDGKERMEM